MYFDSYATGKRIQQLRKANGMTQEEMAIRLNISDRHLGRLERGECAASIDLMVEVVVLLKANLDFLIIGVTETPRERDLIAHIKKQNKTIRMFKDGLNTLIPELTETEIAEVYLPEAEKRFSASFLRIFLTLLRKTGHGMFGFFIKKTRFFSKIGRNAS